ncbi:MAG: hypothetical protein JNK16_07600 [Phycisphaerales bacterium]|nr:hypothetical protein [Phycisphaerales bacterium]
MSRTLQPSARLFHITTRTLLALCACTLLAACASKSDSQWKGDDGGYGGTGRFNPVGSEAGSSEGQYNNLGSKK